MHGAELTRNHSHRDVRGAGVSSSEPMHGRPSHFNVQQKVFTMARLGESLTMNLTRSMAGSERRPVASTRKMARWWGGVIHEVAEARAVPGPFVRLAERKDPG